MENIYIFYKVKFSKNSNDEKDFEKQHSFW